MPDPAIVLEAQHGKCQWWEQVVSRSIWSSWYVTWYSSIPICADIARKLVMYLSNRNAHCQYVDNLIVENHPTVSLSLPAEQIGCALPCIIARYLHANKAFATTKYSPENVASKARFLMVFITRSKTPKNRNQVFEFMQNHSKRSPSHLGTAVARLKFC